MGRANDKPHGSDPLIDEIREIRRAISEAYENDILRLGKRLQEIQRQYPERLIRREDRGHRTDLNPNQDPASQQPQSC
jgi:hypothetical protein